jgi:hypothetical protein
MISTVCFFIKSDFIDRYGSQKRITVIKKQVLNDSNDLFDIPQYFL